MVSIYKVRTSPVKAGIDETEFGCLLRGRVVSFIIMEKSPTTIPIYTIGYGSRSITELIEVLHQHEIAYLIDVRSAP